ncbi:carboxypeptidase-like regulatory domain-containing protein [Blastopirellula marina]|uniref:Carboxypeptidase regulatory-like domain-containing protein n=1 Tax=Blastopirellula marina DSM 3645 TaxID=314230 RepID=A3ZXF7_9BACT|nr:carboxypeptidase-like regulatory domain-containing protein [Blastopirellula marina]EAQ78747.1 hypothetical protein DSM3645_29636 [Blastopirellula marina DSM 3645]
MHRIFVAALFLIGLSGCFGSGGPELGIVEGTVKLDGQPLEGATISFVPAAGGRTAEGFTDAEGHYAVEFAAGAKGALLGEHKVRITTLKEKVMSDSGRVADPGIPEKVPARFNSETELIRDVQPGQNIFDLDLQSK